MWATENTKLKAWHTPYGHARIGEVHGTPTFEYITTLNDSSTFHLNQASTWLPNNEKSFGHIKTKFVFRRESFAYCCFSMLLLLLENLQCNSCSIHHEWLLERSFPVKQLPSVCRLEWNILQLLSAIPVHVNSLFHPFVSSSVLQRK